MPTNLRRSGADPSHARAARTRRRAWLLLAAAAWNAYVWLTRLGIVVDQSQTVPFRVVHGVLIAVSLAFAAALGFVGWRMRREARDAVAEHDS